MEIRPIEPGDAERLQGFFDRVPEGDRTFFKEDVSDADVVAGWASDQRARRHLAVDGGAVVGYVAVIPLLGWSAHVGELRLVVDPSHRRTGLGRRLARVGLLQALELGLTKVSVEVVAEQEGAILMFQAIGFEAEALLRCHVRDRGGELRDLVLLAHLVDDTWSAMATAGLEDELT